MGGWWPRPGAVGEAERMGTAKVNESFQSLVLKGSRDMGCEVKRQGLEGRTSCKGMGWRNGDGEEAEQSLGSQKEDA